MNYLIFHNFLPVLFIGGSFLSIKMASASSIIAEKMNLYNITPTVIPLPPNETLKVTYLDDFVIEPGMMIQNVSFLTYEPEVSWKCNSSINYTLMFHNLEGEVRMTDLDSWLVVNIADCDVGKSDIIFKYTEPTPRKGINRFLFLVYEQVANVDVDSIMGDPHTRFAFRPIDFVNSHFLFDPVAGNFFLIDWPHDFVITGSDYTTLPPWAVVPPNLNF